MLYPQGEPPALTFLGLSAPARLLGLPEEKEWSFVLLLPWGVGGEGQRSKGRELLLLEGRKAINW